MRNIVEWLRSRQLPTFGELVDTVVNDIGQLAQGSPGSTTTHAAGGKAPVVTTTKVVYITMAPTFAGEVASFITLDSAPTTKAGAAATVTQQPTTKTVLPESLIPAVAGPPDSTLAMATKTTAAPSTLLDKGDASATTSTSASSSSTALASSPDGGGDVSGAAKAGIAIGVLAGLLVVFMLVYYLFNKRRKEMQQQRLDDDEKINGPFSDTGRYAESGRAPPTPNKAPRLSLRPVTQFLPNLMVMDRRTSKGANIMLATSPPGTYSSAMAAANNNGGGNSGPTGGRAFGGSAWERPLTSQSNHADNPFGHYAERMPTPIIEETASAMNRPVSPMSDTERHYGNHNQQGINPLPPTPPEMHQAQFGSQPQTRQQDGYYYPPAPAVADAAPAPAPTRAPAAMGAAAAVSSLTRKTSIRKDGPMALDLTLGARDEPRSGGTALAPVPPSPAGTEFSIHSVAPGQAPMSTPTSAAIAAAGGPPLATVHRVQLDFKPTLDDELELRAGQLVRLLHEYDDGWALCIRLDRSQQGVVPRTCLSTRPVAPRPQNGPGPGGRIGPPVNPSGGGRGPGPNYPPGHRPMTAQGGPPYPRPDSPNRPRTSAGPGGRPQSPMGNRPMSPYGGRPASPGPGRPMSPGPGRPGGRSQSPGPRYQQQGRSQSPGGTSRRHSPPGPGPSPMNPVINVLSTSPPNGRQGPPQRKPVPGQAY